MAAGSQIVNLRQDSKCAASLQRIEKQMAQLITCMSDLAASIKELLFLASERALPQMGEYLGLFKAIFYFPNGNPPFGESIVNIFYFLGTP